MSFPATGMLESPLKKAPSGEISLTNLEQITKSIVLLSIDYPADDCNSTARNIADAFSKLSRRPPLDN
jgi:hypothetical protein